MFISSSEDRVENSDFAQRPSEDEIYPVQFFVAWVYIRNNFCSCLLRF